MAQYGHFRHLNAVFTRWPATAAESSNLSMQGDVIEYILYHLKFTGPAIEKSLRDAREALHAAIRSFGDNMLRLMNLCGGKPIQYVIVARRPDPRLFTTLMLQALKVHTVTKFARFLLGWRQNLLLRSRPNLTVVWSSGKVVWLTTVIGTTLAYCTSSDTPWLSMGMTGI